MVFRFPFLPDLKICARGLLAGAWGCALFGNSGHLTPGCYPVCLLWTKWCMGYTECSPVHKYALQSHLFGSGGGADCLSPFLLFMIPTGCLNLLQGCYNWLSPSPSDVPFSSVPFSPFFMEWVNVRLSYAYILPSAFSFIADLPGGGGGDLSAFLHF